jgi:hypothetical protein
MTSDPLWKPIYQVPRPNPVPDLAQMFISKLKYRENLVGPEGNEQRAQPERVPFKIEVRAA